MYTEIIDQWKEANPLSCHYLGIHDFDGKLPNMAPAFIDRRIEEIKADLKIIEEHPVPTERMELYEYRLVLARLKTELFSLDVQKEYEVNPATWIYPLSLIETSYTARSFAPLEERVQSIIEIEIAIPEYLEHAYTHFKESLPKAKIMMGIRFISGIIPFYKDKLISYITKADVSEETLNRWSEANIGAIEAMEVFKQKLETVYLPKAHTDFALGTEKFMELLLNTEQIQISYEELLKVGEADLERNYLAMMALKDQVPNGDLDAFLADVNADTPDPDKLVEEARETLDVTRQFLIDTGIVGLPSDKHCDVIETPKFAQSFAFAAMNTPGPFEVPEASEAYYWITPPQSDWPQERIESFMKFFNRPFLHMVTIHECYPGHYVQLLYNQQAESDIAKMLARSTTMIEGWAHYAEEMIYDAGYDALDRTRLKVGQLYGALVRNCRYVSALKMHCEGWTVEQSKELFMSKGFMPEPNADIEANRGTIDPMYLNYTLGKLLILKLRSDYQKEQGDHYSLRNFHDELLSYGSPPITILRELMLSSTDISEVL